MITGQVEQREIWPRSAPSESHRRAAPFGRILGLAGLILVSSAPCWGQAEASKTSPVKQSPPFADSTSQDRKPADQPPNGRASGKESPGKAPPKPAQPTDPTKESAPPAKSDETKQKKESGKSLDELLGIPSGKEGGSEKREGDSGGSDQGPADAKRRLERGLSEAEVESLLQQALVGMEESASQLGERTDSGLTTQRVQEDVVAKLDRLIEEAKRRKSSSQNRPSGESGQGQTGQKPQSGSGKSADGSAGKPGESKSRDGSTRKPGEATREGDPAAPVEPDADQRALDETQAEWGALPERVRDLIRQGSRDRVASLYQRLTQEYYRRMAEDASR